MTTPEASALRHQAEQARRTARAVQASSVHQLAALAGDDTWHGPTAFAFRDELRRALDAFEDTRRSLRTLADRLDERARQLDLAAQGR